MEATAQALEENLANATPAPGQEMAMLGISWLQAWLCHAVKKLRSKTHLAQAVCFWSAESKSI